MSLSRRRVLQMALAPALLRRLQVQDLAPTASRIYPGTDNKLVYVPDELGNIVIDSSSSVTIKSLSTMLLQASGTMTVKGSTINLN